MRTFYILFYGRPEVISKLRSLYHDMDFRIKAAHSVGGAYNIIFGNRRTEHTGFAEFLLHTFGDIKHTAFLSVCYVLSPDKRIGIVAEFGFQCLVNGIYQEGLFALCFMSTFFVLLGLIRIGHHKIVDTLRIRIGSSQRFSVGSRQFFLCVSFDLLQLFFCQAFVTQQHPAEFH